MEECSKEMLVGVKNDTASA
jgi:hypothetical protein